MTFSLKNLFKTVAAKRAMRAVVKAVRNEHRDNGFTRNLDKNVTGNHRSGIFRLKVNGINIQNSDLGNRFHTIGKYAAGHHEPDVLHVDKSTLRYHTRNFQALKDALNQHVLSPKNQITCEL